MDVAPWSMVLIVDGLNWDGDDDDLSLLQSKACSTFEFILASTFNSDESLSSTEAKTCKHK